MKIIQKFKCRSEVELIKIFRMSLANSRKKSLLDKIRSAVVQEAVVKTAELMKNYNIVKD